MDLWQPAVDLAAQLTAAGLRATTDPADTHAPVALVTPTGVVMLGSRCAVVTVQVLLSTGGLDHSQLAWLWSTALPTLLEVAGAEQVEPTQTLDGRPAVEVLIERKVT